MTKYVEISDDAMALIIDLRKQLAEKDQTILDHVEIQNALRQQLTDAQEDAKHAWEKAGEACTAHADSIKREVILRNAIHDGCLCIAQYGEQPPDCLLEALAATADLDGVILCDAEPVRYIYEFKDYEGRTIWSSNLDHNGQTPTATIPLYRAWEPK